jgi:hypothetical protein
VRCPWKRSHLTLFAPEWSPMSLRSSRQPTTRTGHPPSRSRLGSCSCSGLSTVAYALVNRSDCGWRPASRSTPYALLF